MFVVEQRPDEEGVSKSMMRGFSEDGVFRFLVRRFWNMTVSTNE